MKKITATVVLFLLTTFFASRTASAQWSTSAQRTASAQWSTSAQRTASAQWSTSAQRAASARWSAAEQCMDRDIFAMQNNMGFHNYHYDDYLQYSPAALMLLMKTCGYKSANGWGRMLTSSAFSTALMAATVNGLKYTTNRERPLGQNAKSFPSGHTATAFMCATMLHREYGWRSPWWSIGGYSAALVTSFARNLNDAHWWTDTFAGAIIGIGATELGYFFADLIFKDKYQIWKPEQFDYCSEHNKYYSLGVIYSRRFILGHKDMKEASVFPFRGSNIALQADVPLIAGSGLVFRVGAGSLLFRDGSSFNVYNGQVGMFWERDFARVLEFELHGLIGYAGYPSKAGSTVSGLEAGYVRGGIDMTASASLNLIAGNHCKIKALAEWETFSYSNGKTAPKEVPLFLNSVLLGISASYYWK